MVATNSISHALLYISYALEVCYKNVLYKLTFDTDICHCYSKLNTGRTP